VPHVRVLAKKSPLQFLIRKPPVMRTSGGAVTLAWGRESSIEVPAGEQDLLIYFPYLGREAGKASLRLQGGEPGPLVRYKTPFLVTQHGKVKIDG
jgi:hypothetical protein